MIVSHIKPAGWVDTDEVGLIQPSAVAGMDHVVTLEPEDIALLTGPAGPQGPQGVPGVGAGDPVPGPQGPQGLPGADGAAGAVGAQGPQGLPGADGAAGAVGAQGPQGLPGADGAAGAVGPQGPRGLPGADGAAGAVGPQGAAGVNAVGFVEIDAGLLVDGGPGSFYVNHAFGVVPSFVVFELECVVPELGYSVGDRVQPYGVWNGGAGAYGLSIFKDAVRLGATGFSGYGVFVWGRDGVGGNLASVGKWRVKYRVLV